MKQVRCLFQNIISSTKKQHAPTPRRLAFETHKCQPFTKYAAPDQTYGLTGPLVFGGSKNGAKYHSNEKSWKVYVS